MLEAIVIIVYLAFCILVALCGCQRRIGFTGTFLLSLFFTPIVVLIFLLLTAPSQRADRARNAQSN